MVSNDEVAQRPVGHHVHVESFSLTMGLASFPAPPRLRADAFAVRPFTGTDLDVVAEAATDPHIPRMTSVPVPYTDAAGREFLTRQRDRLRTDLGYSLAIVDARSDVAVGQVGLWLRNHDKGRASIGYWVVPSARGRGAARQAICLIAGWAFTALQLPRLELYVEPWNTPSIRTAQAAGFHREGIMRSWEQVGDERRDMIMFSLLHTDSSWGTPPVDTTRRGR